jgi:uncharacterized protein (TIGR02996 family)
MSADALLAEVLAGPDDAAPRLIYADWLDDRGEADRATFICAQVRLAHFDWRSIPPGVERYRGEQGALQRQADELWRRHKEEWLGELPRSLRRGQARFHRGFVAELCGSPRQLLAVSARVWVRHPIQELTI